jgi:hypothetical protein
MLLLYPERGLALSETATAILKLCDGDHSPDDIARMLADAHPGTHPDAIRDDVGSFLEEMRRRGLVDP